MSRRAESTPFYDRLVPVKNSRAWSEAKKAYKDAEQFMKMDEGVFKADDKSLHLAASNLKELMDIVKKSSLGNAESSELLEHPTNNVKQAHQTQSVTSYSLQKYSAMYILVNTEAIITEDTQKHLSDIPKNTPSNSKQYFSLKTFIRRKSTVSISVPDALDGSQPNFSPELQDITTRICDLVRDVKTMDLTGIRHGQSAALGDQLVDDLAKMFNRFVIMMRDSGDSFVHFTQQIYPEALLITSQLREVISHGYKTPDAIQRLYQLRRDISHLKNLVDEALQPVQSLKVFQYKNNVPSPNYNKKQLENDLEILARSHNPELIFYTGPMNNARPKGHGAYGGITSFDLENKTVAAKSFTAYSSTSVEDYRVCDRIRREAQVWCSLKHDNITPILGFCCSPDTGDLPSIISPYFEEGDLQKYLKEHGSSIDTSTRLSFLYDIASALAYMHSQKTFHGDLKTNNVLVEIRKTGPLAGRAKVYLCDFGLSATPTSNLSMVPTSSQVRFRAPEHNEHDPTKKPTAYTDMYAFGGLFIQVITGLNPWNSINDRDLDKKRSENRFILPTEELEAVDKIDKFYGAFVRRCLSKSPQGRPTAAVAVAALKMYVERETGKARASI